MEKEQPLRLGFYGGSFDPVHLGHLVIAQDALEYAGLSQLYFVPTAQNPLKPGAPRASARQRVDMLRLALRGRERMEVLEDEIERKGVSYTLDTVHGFQIRWPTAELFWIIGADQVEQLPRWHRIDELAQAVRFLCFSRPGYSLSIPPSIPADRLVVLAERQIPTSSTKIRDVLAAGEPADLFLPPAVANYIKEAHLYAG